MKQELQDKTSQVRKLEQTVQQLAYEKELRDMRGSNNQFDFSGIKGIGELEAQLNFKEKEVQELRVQIEEQKISYKKQLKEYKEELQVTKERLIK